MTLREFVSGGTAQPQQFLENGGSAGGVLLVLLPGFKGRYTVGEGWGEQHNADSGKNPRSSRSRGPVIPRRVIPADALR
jgi:hypothetical protein